MKKHIIIIFLLALFIYSIGGVFYFFRDKEEEIEPVMQIAIINNYNYELKSNATSLLKKEFDLLKENLENPEIDDLKYAQSIAKLFIIDLYTINNKVNMFDIGGKDYVMPIALDNFKLNVKDTIYKYVEDNTDGSRDQILPEVDDINIIDCNPMEFKINDVAYSGYKINLEWSYITDLGYDTSAEVIVIKDDIYYYIAEKK